MRGHRFVGIAALLFAGGASAQEVPATEATRPLELTAAQPSSPEAPASPFVLSSGRATLTLAGYVEALYQWNFNNPENGVTAWRGFDNRHNTITLSNVVLDASWQYRAMVGRLALQVGHTPESYYSAEPARRALAGVGATGSEVWKYLQQATVGARAGAWLVEAGIFLSPIGPEAMPVRDNWNWSRSNLFYGLPFYHTGLRVTHTVNARHSVAFGVFNGWNSVVDNNVAKSVLLQYTYAPSADVTFNALYFGGIERDRADAAGVAWRSLFDVYLRVRVGRRVTVMGHLNAGFEPNNFGVNYWSAAAAYARFELTDTLRLALRADFFFDRAPAMGTRIFWAADWMTSQTATLEYAPFEHLSARLEYRHDHAEAPVFYQGSATDPSAASQDTLTLGMVAGF
jgi:hypothetical protein